ncbi:MAG TPA: aminopeptidase [Candidatus Limiplasma sp.]|nr:aminopeptidase [Candidatus Limiplasma sp.]
MKDPRLQKLCNMLINYSCEVKKGDKIMIELFGYQPEIVQTLIDEVYAVGGIPFVRQHDMQVRRKLMQGATSEQYRISADNDAALMRQMQAYLGVRAYDNTYELSDVSADQMERYMKEYSAKVHGKIRIPDTRWCVLRYPNFAMSQSAKMSTEAFEDYYYAVCTMDYAKMSKAMNALKDRMDQAKTVHIQGPDTDLTFSIQGIPTIICDGKLNIPDGEVYTAPVKTSINGTIRYNTASLYMGKVYTDIRFTFKDGKIIQATCNDTEGLNKILDTDEGARYVGEFSFGVNPFVTTPIQDTLFDEKIAGSFHLTPGNCYDEAPNGNHSDIHWDIVNIQRPEYGGGMIWLDNELVRKDGLFVPDDLLALNPDAFV